MPEHHVTSICSTHQAIIVKVQNMHGLPNFVVHSVKICLNAGQDARHLVRQPLLPDHLLQLLRPLSLVQAGQNKG